MAPATNLKPIETAAQAAQQPYPTSPAVGTLKFTATAGAAEARVMSIEPPIRPGHRKRLRLHLTTALAKGERLRDLQLECEGAATLGLRGELKVISVRPLVPARPKGERGNRIRRAVRRHQREVQLAAAKGTPAPDAPKDRRRKANTAPKAKAAVKPAPRPKRTPTGYSVVVEL
ncbi:MAG: hypothetical protein ACYTGX_02625 [Planctomycetota bacterium]|jgi:hypothetical protein